MPTLSVKLPESVARNFQQNCEAAGDTVSTTIRRWVEASLSGDMMALHNSNGVPVGYLYLADVCPGCGGAAGGCA